MKTITIQIGNSDDKLTQARWALFYQLKPDSWTYAEDRYQLWQRENGGVA